MNKLYESNQQIFFESEAGDTLLMENLSALYKMYHESEKEEVKQRIQHIFESNFGKLLVAEIMIDMTNAHIIERLHTGEISKTLGHVNDYNIILYSEEEKVRVQYTGDFEIVCFARFPYGIVVQEQHFSGYKNDNCEIKIIL